MRIQELKDYMSILLTSTNNLTSESSHTHWQDRHTVRNLSAKKVSNVEQTRAGSFARVVKNPDHPGQ